MEILNKLKSNLDLQRISYFFMTLDYRGHDALNIFQSKDAFINEKLEVIYPIIKEIIINNDNSENDLRKHITEKHPYSDYLLENELVPFELAVFCLLLYSYSIKDLLGGNLEILPDDSNDKYKIVKLEKGEVFTHEGVKHGEKFYYYSPFLLNYKRIQSEPTELIKLLTEENVNNEVWLRLDDNLSIPFVQYSPNYKFFASVYWGKEINLDNLEFPYHAENISLSVYNPENMKRIQFKISTRKDNEKWIEVEELFHLDEKSSNYVTKYLHSIYEPDTDSFVHIDGSYNFYSYTSYKARIKTNINAHADNHEKLWLIEGGISKVKWAKLIYRFFEDDDLISDAFSGELSEEVLDEIIEP